MATSIPQWRPFRVRSVRSPSALIAPPRQEWRQVTESVGRPLRHRRLPVVAVPATCVLVWQAAPTPVGSRAIGSLAELVEGVDVLVRHRAQMGPVITHVEYVGDCSPGCNLLSLVAGPSTVPSGASPSHRSRGLTRVPSDSVNRCRWAKSQRPKARSIAEANWVKECEGAAAKIRPGRGHRSAPCPETNSTRMDSHVRATIRTPS